ncbi:apelin receptor-like [Acipenser oxyrinchus oxyrinchus]|uniref:Apelin receptor-like n=1 Tax=Acipenser oxyrinchus oxyrinchus TaxID=40147 RepID=A0AAD8G8A4_ACIOX|nr:apelin receptor-like [Acipenser oxyrinchus oxyrinchus]
MANSEGATDFTENQTASLYYDYFNYTHVDIPLPEDPIITHFNTVTFIMVMYCFVFLFGTMGNIFVIYIMLRKKRKRRHADIFITHLAFADLVFLITLPLWVVSLALNNRWPFGDFFCKVASYIISVNMFSSFLMTCMSINRYMTIVLSIDIRAMRIKRYTQIMVVIVWVLSVGLGIQVFFFRIVNEDHDLKYCSEVNSVAKTLFSLFTRVVAFLLPLLIITVSYSSIAVKLNRHFTRMNNDGRKQRRSIKTGLWIIAMFVISWLPFNILTTIRTLKESKYIELSSENAHWVDRSLSFTTCLAFSNSCVNPIIYVVFDGYFQRCFLKVFPCAIAQILATRRSSLSISVSHVERDLASNKDIFPGGRHHSSTEMK